VRLENVKGSKNFVDKTVWGPTDYFHDAMFRLLYPFMSMAGATGTAIDPRVNDAYVARARKYKPTDLKDSITNYTPEEQKLMREQGFGLEDIQVMRDYKRSQNKNKFRVEEDGSVSRR
jgi:hypothetical protein